MIHDKAKMDEILKTAHGRKSNVAMMAHQGMNEFLGGHSQFPAQNPLTATGGRVLEGMKHSYGAKKGKRVFYASINKGKKGSTKWHK